MASGTSSDFDQLPTFVNGGRLRLFFTDSAGKPRNRSATLMDIVNVLKQVTDDQRAYVFKALGSKPPKERRKPRASKVDDDDTRAIIAWVTRRLLSGDC